MAKRVVPQNQRPAWKEQPFETTVVGGLSIWAWAAIGYYIFWIFFASVVSSQAMPSLTKAWLMLVSFGTGLGLAAASYLLETERRRAK